jgi:hypothetical protein
MRATSQQQRKRPLRVLVWALGLFVAIQLGVGLVLDYGFPLMRFPSAARVLESLPADPSSVEVLFLGSSRFGAGIDAGEVGSLLETAGSPRRLCPVVNASVPAGDLITSEFLFGQLLDRGVRPRIVVVEISPETLNHYNEWLGFHVVRQLRWEHVPAYWYETCRAGHGMRFLSARLFPLFQHRQLILDWVRGPGTRERASPNACELDVKRRPDGREELDWETLLRPPAAEVKPELKEWIRVTTEHQPRRWLRYFRIAGNSPAALERLLTECKRRQIEVLLIRVPVTTTHRETYTPAIEQEFQTFVGKLRRTHPCRFVDCVDWLADGLFIDNHHLNSAGQLYFSRLLTYRTLLPFWQGKEAVLKQDPG